MVENENVPNLKFLTKENEKGTIKLNRSVIEDLIEENKSYTNLEKIEKFIVPEQDFYFYFYSSESVDDLGWGCAWRSIQTQLSFFKCDIDFKTLFYKYGLRNELSKIYKRMNLIDENKPLPSFFNNVKFAPFENQSYWAEPFIANLILFNEKNIKGRLILINGYPNAYAPVNVFEDKFYKPIEFFKLLEEHFSNNKSPIVLDDSIYCFSIIGFKSTTNTFSLIFGDPHVGEIERGEMYIYELTYDFDGTLLIDNKELSNIENNIYYKKIKRNMKNKWMAFIPI